MPHTPFDRHVERMVSSIQQSQEERLWHRRIVSLYTWMSRFKEHPTEPFVGSGNLHQEDAELRAFKKRIKDLEEEKEFLKKASARQLENRSLLEQIRRIHEASRGTYGSKKITHEVNRKSDEQFNHKRIERIMRENGIQSKVRKKYKAATNSKHSLPAAENILNRDFKADRPGQKMVSDITYIPTDEGWLCLAGVMDLCGNKIVGISMDERMTKELVIAALKDAVRHTRSTEGCILHSDRGSQYCSLDYQALAKEHGFISSMSRKGNCWDNAPMESFWGKLKQEWLNEQHFRTREEARSAVFEYIWIFYNRKRIHEANGCLTPEDYYRRHQTDLKAA